MQSLLNHNPKIVDVKQAMVKHSIGINCQNAEEIQKMVKDIIPK